MSGSWSRSAGPRGRIDRKEEELQRYVGELQGVMSRKDPWWPGTDDALIKH